MTAYIGKIRPGRNQSHKAFTWAIIFSFCVTVVSFTRDSAGGPGQPWSRPAAGRDFSSGSWTHEIALAEIGANLDTAEHLCASTVVVVQDVGPVASGRGEVQSMAGVAIGN